MAKLQQWAQLEAMTPGYPHPLVYQDRLPGGPGLPTPGSNLHPMGHSVHTLTRYANHVDQPMAGLYRYQDAVGGTSAVAPQLPAGGLSSSLSGGGLTGGFSRDVAGGLTGGLAGGFSRDVSSGLTGGLAGGFSRDVSGGLTGGLTGGFSGGFASASSGAFTSGLAGAPSLGGMNTVTHPALPQNMAQVAGDVAGVAKKGKGRGKGVDIHYDITADGKATAICGLKGKNGKTSSSSSSSNFVHVVVPLHGYIPPCRDHVLVEIYKHRLLWLEVRNPDAQELGQPDIPGKPHPHPHPHLSHPEPPRPPDSPPV